MSRIDDKFKELRARNKKAFIAFITAGDPSLNDTEKLVVALDKSGVDIMELGVPFSDPLADGPTIQASSHRALNRGVSLDKILNTVRKIRKATNIPIALMSYYNPIFHYGERNFIHKAKISGVDGIIIPDLPPDEDNKLFLFARKQDISTVFFITPTTTIKRQKYISRVSTGFIYFISLTGVTGARTDGPKNITHKLRHIKKITNKPVCVGFGISDERQVLSMSKISDGVIVGSAIVNEINRNTGKKSLVSNVSNFVTKLSRVL